MSLSLLSIVLSFPPVCLQTTTSIHYWQSNVTRLTPLLSAHFPPVCPNSPAVSGDIQLHINYFIYRSGYFASRFHPWSTSKYIQSSFSVLLLTLFLIGLILCTPVVILVLCKKNKAGWRSFFEMTLPYFPHYKADYKVHVQWTAYLKTVFTYRTHRIIRCIE